MPGGSLLHKHNKWPLLCFWRFKKDHSLVEYSETAKKRQQMWLHDTTDHYKGNWRQENAQMFIASAFAPSLTP